MNFVWYGSFCHWKCSKFSSLTNTVLKKRHILSLSRCIHLNSIHQTSHETKDAPEREKAKFVTFNDMVHARRDEAERSILVQVQSSKSARELHGYCNSFGTVKSMFHYSTGIEPMHFVLVEFSKKADVEAILSKSSYLDLSQAVPVCSPFLWFRATSKKETKHKSKGYKKLDAENATAAIKDEDVKHEISKCSNISDQMVRLHQLTRLNDVGTRLRFLTARQVETCISGMFPYAKAYPFGSSVNGFGKMGCDLDLVLRLSDKEVDDSRRLVFHGKASSGTERSNCQRVLEVIGDLMQLFLPGCAQVRRILQARVPIVKYNQQLTGIECDLSMTNMSGFYMSDFLYMMGAIDTRVQPLVYAIRKWASEVGVTNTSPGRWLSNFSLTLLVLAFLQRPLNSPPILPALSTLVKAARASDKYVTEDGINCTFLRDMTKISGKTKNEESLESLLKEFFEYYAQFDFTSKAISLNEAIAFSKPEHSPMYIVNPLERGLNVSKNVSLEEVERFKMEVRNAAWVLESQENKSPNWGLLAIFNSKRRVEPFNYILSTKHARLMEVRKLFEEEETEKDNPGVESKTQQMNFEDSEDEEPTPEFKNETVRRQVESIKSETQEKIKELKADAKSNR